MSSAEPVGVEITCAIVKPDATTRGQANAILDRIKASGLEVVLEARTTLSREQAELFYNEHVGKPHFERIVANLSSAPVVAAIVRGANAVSEWRRLLGPTDPEQAPAGTIRGDFGTTLPDNAAHGSSDGESASREIGILFPNVRLHNGAKS